MLGFSVGRLNNCSQFRIHAAVTKPRERPRPASPAPARLRFRRLYGSGRGQSLLLCRTIPCCERAIINCPLAARALITHFSTISLPPKSGLRYPPAPTYSSRTADSVVPGSYTVVSKGNNRSANTTLLTTNDALENPTIGRGTSLAITQFSGKKRQVHLNRNL